MYEYGVSEFNDDVRNLAVRIKASMMMQNGRAIDGIYGIPKGGVPLAIALSQALHLPVVALIQNVTNRTLVVDDIVDSGNTMRRFYRNDNGGIGAWTASIHVSGKADFEPDFFCHKSNDWINYWWEGEAETASIEDNVTRIIQYIGDDPTRKSLIKTPARVAKMYKDLFCGYDDTRLPGLALEENGADDDEYHDMVRDSGYFFSYCEHHMVPFFGEYYYGYIPGPYIIGASKIGRTVDYFAGKLQKSERLVHNVVKRIDSEAKPLGQILIINARHLCKEMRGLRKYNSPFETIAVRGYFAENRNGCKDEFLARIPVK